eukprot:1452239-Rhodomonas_salina.1
MCIRDRWKGVPQLHPGKKNTRLIERGLTRRTRRTRISRSQRDHDQLEDWCKARTLRLKV